jgi:hypothetical protein
MGVWPPKIWNKDADGRLGARKPSCLPCTRYLDGLRHQSHHSADNDEREWKNLTMNIFIHGFGEDSPNVRQLKGAIWLVVISTPG